MFQNHAYRRAVALPRPPTYIARSLSYCRPLTFNLSHVGALSPQASHGLGAGPQTRLGGASVGNPLRHNAEMEQLPVDTPRLATVAEVASVAGLLDAFNREYDTPTPGKAVLATRLGRLLASGEVVALLTGDPAVAVVLLTLRPNVWYDGPVALLDELYVAPEVRRRGRLGTAGGRRGVDPTAWRGAARDQC